MVSKSTADVIEFMLRNLNKYNINQIARNVKISVGSSYKILKMLEKRRIAKSESIGNAIYYTLNLDNNEARKFSELVLIESKNRMLSSNRYAKIYADDLERIKNLSQAIILFGSLLREKEKARDVDVLFVTTRKNIKRIMNTCKEISKIRPKTIAPLLMTKADLREKIKARDNVVLDILKNGIVLHGEEVIIEALK